MKKILLTFLLSSIFFGTQALHEDFQLERNKEELIKLYKKYLNTVSGQPDMLAAYKDKLKPAILKQIIPHLDVDLSLREIEENYNQVGFLQLRKIDPRSRTLIIGCGNRPFSYYDLHAVVRDEEYSMQHVHEGAITVDPDLRRNPTIVAYFGMKPLRSFADNLFDRVLVESIGFSSLLDTGYFVSDLTRILVDGGKFYFDLGGYGPLRIEISKLNEFARRWDENLESLFVEARNRLSLLPDLFKKMVVMSGSQEVKDWFKKLLKEGNWVHEGKTWEESFSIINEKVNRRNRSSWRLVRWVRRLIWWMWPLDLSFTIKESRLIRLAAMELDVSLGTSL